MSNLVKINEDYQQFIQQYKIISGPIVSFSNSIFSYSLSIAQETNNVMQHPPKEYLIKRVRPCPANVSIFETFLQKVFDFQYTTFTPNLLRVGSVYKDGDFYVLVQRNYKEKLSPDVAEKFREIEVLNVLKDIIQFFSQFLDEDVIECFLSNELPIQPITLDAVYRYSKVPIKNPQAIKRRKLKIDIIQFKDSEQVNNEGKDSFQISEFLVIIKKLFAQKSIGICSRNLLRVAEEGNCTWRHFIKHPLFRSACLDQESDFAFWAKQDKDYKKGVPNVEEKKIPLPQLKKNSDGNESDLIDERGSNHRQRVKSNPTATNTAKYLDKQKNSIEIISKEKTSEKSLVKEKNHIEISKDKNVEKASKTCGDCHIF